MENKYFQKMNKIRKSNLARWPFRQTSPKSVIWCLESWQSGCVKPATAVIMKGTDLNALFVNLYIFCFVWRTISTLLAVLTFETFLFFLKKKHSEGKNLQVYQGERTVWEGKKKRRKKNVASFTRYTSKQKTKRKKGEKRERIFIST